MLQTNYSKQREKACPFKFSAQLEDPNTALKTYWSSLNRFLNNKKIPNVTSLFVNDEVASNFSEKAELFNSYFASQCSPIVNISKLPSLEYKNLKVDKARGWNNISIRMIKLCNKSAALP